MNWIKKNKFGMIVTLVTIILLVFISFTSPGRETMTRAEGLISRAIAPVQKTLYTGAHYIRNFFDSVFEIGTLRSTNEDLTEEIEALREKLVDYEMTKSENQRLSNLLDFKKTNPEYQYTISRVVSIDPEVWFNVFVIDKGSDHGVSKNMPIVVSEGLIGRVVEVGSGTSKVLAITDMGSTINGVISRTGDYIRVQGSTGSYLDGYVDPNTSLMPGDMVVTSGLGEIFPEGLIIGQVENIYKEEGALEKRVEILPSVDMQKIKEVFIIEEN